MATDISKCNQVTVMNELPTKGMIQFPQISFFCHGDELVVWTTVSYKNECDHGWTTDVIKGIIQGITAVGIKWGWTIGRDLPLRQWTLWGSWQILREMGKTVEVEEGGGSYLVFP